MLSSFNRFNWIRFGLLISGLFFMALALGFILNLDFVLNSWPWAGAYTGLSPLSALFLGSIAAAIGAPVLWIALTGSQRSSEAGALNLIITFAGIAIFLFQGYADRGATTLLVSGLICAAVAGGSLFILIYSVRFPPADRRPTPPLVRLSFLAFAVILTLVGGGLALKIPNIFPWSLTVEMSVVYGWIFLGAAAYFYHAVLRPDWTNAVGQLLGFLAYDLVLIVPFVQHLAVVDASLRINLIVYIAVLAYSAALAIYYLFLNPKTRLIGGALSV